jgi:hypothetical protein
VRDVAAQRALVQPLALAQREDVELVAIVRDDDDSGVRRLSVDGDAEASRAPEQQADRLEARRCTSRA